MSSIQPTLWDQCVLYLLSTIDTYPITLLAMLPLHIRKKIFMALSILDRLHFMDTEFMNGLEMVEYRDYTPDSNTMVTLSTKESSNEIKRCIVPAIFTRSALEGFSMLDCDNFIYLFQCIRSYSNPAEALSLLLDWIDLVEFNSMGLRKCYFGVLGLVSSRHYETFEYFALWSEYGSSPPPMATDGQSVITYCNLNKFGPAYLSRLTITKDFLYSLFWYEYKSALDKAIQQAKIKGIRDLTTIDSTLARPIYPHLQELLSHVEKLHFEVVDGNKEYEAYVIVPYLLMCNAIANRSTARLKSIYISRVGYKEASTLYTIAGFLVGCDFFASSYCYNVEISDDDGNQYRYSLCPPEGEPYCRIEEIAIGFSSWNAIDFQVLEVVLEKQMSTLTTLTIGSFLNSQRNTPEYRQLLTGTLVQFVKQPQFCFLTLRGETPEGSCYELVKAFLTSPTSREQQLNIKVVEDKQAVDNFLPSDYCQLDKLDCHPSCALFKGIKLHYEYKCKLAEEIKQYLFTID